MSIIKVNNINFYYPNTKALDNINFTIPSCSITALVGPNGAGKTTLLSCLTGLLTPFSGEIFIDDIALTENPRECHRLIGYLPDDYGVYDSLTVLQNLQFMAVLQNISNHEINSRIKEITQALNIFDRLKVTAGELSRGLKQRLGIAMAIIHKPKILLLDEPASGLDPKARIELSKLFVSLKESGITLIVSSHILSELAEYSTHMMIIKDAKLLEFSEITTKDSPKDLGEHYLKVMEEHNAH